MKLLTANSTEAELNNALTVFNAEYSLYDDFHELYIDDNFFVKSTHKEHIIQVLNRLIALRNGEGGTSESEKKPVLKPLI